MEALSARKERVLEALDAEIEELEKKLAKYQPFIDELNQLRQTRKVLLNERSVTQGRRGSLDMETVIHFLTENGQSSVREIAEGIGFPDTTVRAHLHRHKGTRYEQNGEGWLLTEDGEDE